MALIFGEACLLSMEQAMDALIVKTLLVLTTGGRGKGEIAGRVSRPKTLDVSRWGLF